MKVKSESEAAQLCPTLRNPMDCSLPGSSLHGIFQARVLESGAIAFSIKFVRKEKNMKGARNLFLVEFMDRFLKRIFVLLGQWKM